MSQQHLQKSSRKIKAHWLGAERSDLSLPGQQQQIYQKNQSFKQRWKKSPAFEANYGSQACHFQACWEWLLLHRAEREQDGSIPAHLGTTSIPWIIANQQVVFCSGAGKSLWGSSAEPATCCCPQGWKRMRGCKCSLYPCGHCSHLISTVQFPYDIIDTQTNSAQECQE